jgi:large subunit ribosomal protein L21
MSKVAVIMTGGKQYKVAEGQIVRIEKLAVEPSQVVKFDTLLIADDADIKIGTPSLGELVQGKILEQGKAKKVTVVKYKSKTRYKKTTGHRQSFTKVEIVKIN